jgi:hypothetical protein
MTPFDLNPENDAGHTLDQDDLIAFHLHELSSPQERALRRVLRTRPDLQAESIAIASTLRAFPKHEPALPLDAAALERHWQSLRQSLPLHVPPTPAPRTFFSRWALPALATSTLATAAILLSLHHLAPTPPSIVANNHPPTYALPPASNPSFDGAATLPSSPYTPIHALPSASTHHTTFLNLSQQQPRSAFPSLSSIAPSTPSTARPSSPSEATPANTPLASTDHPATTRYPKASASGLIACCSSGIQPQGHASHPHHDHTTDATFATFADLTSARSFTSTAVTTPYTQSANPSVGVLASFHQQFRPWLGYRITGTHSAPSFQYAYTPTGSNGTAQTVVPENVYEISATYVVQGPHRRRLSTSAEAGAGVLDFHPTNPNAALGVSNSIRSTAVLGISAELALTKQLFVHAGYRALLYKTPTAYLTSGLNIPLSGNLTFSSEPVVGLTYRFRAPRGE